MAHIPTFERDVSADAVVESLEKHGCTVVRRLADPAAVARLNAEFEPYLKAMDHGSSTFDGFRTKRINGLIAKSRTCGEFALNPLVMAVCDRVLLKHAASYRLHITSLIELQPDEKAQVIHRDGLIYPVRFPSITLTVPTMWACTDFTAANGATSIVPGSHLWPDDREPREDEIVPAAMPAGSVLIYTSSLLHGGGRNTTTTGRRGMALHYNLGWLRQEENQYLAVPPQVARTLPDALKRLIGYDLGGPYLGFVEGGNPISAVRDGHPEDKGRSNPAMDAAAKRLTPLLMTPDPTRAAH